MIALVETSLEELVSDWAEDMRADRSAGTILRYQGAVKSFLAWYERAEGRPARPADLTPIAFVGYRTFLSKTSSVSNVNTHVAALRAWSTWLHSRGQLPENPASRLRAVKRQAIQAAPKALSPNQVNALLREAERNGRYPARDKAILMVLLQTGIRIGECVALDLQDIKFGEKSGELLIRNGKGNKSRVVPLNSSARQALADYLVPILKSESTLRSVAAAWPIGLAGAAPIWRSERGRNRMTLSAMERVVSRLLKACKQLPADATAHSLRHTFATRYLASHPGDLIGLAGILGHESLDTTRIYSKPSQDEIIKRVEELDLNAYM